MGKVMIMNLSLIGLLSGTSSWTSIWWQ